MRDEAAHLTDESNRRDDAQSASGASGRASTPEASGPGSPSDTSGSPSVPGDDRPDWWPDAPVPEELDEELRETAAFLEGRLFATERAEEDGMPDLPGEPDAGLGWRAAALLREAILRADEAGAPSRRVEGLHRRLDREAGRLAEGMVRRTMSESRRLLEHVSHDIRSPLNSILFLADTLLNEHSGELNQVQRRQVGVLYTAAVTLVNLVNDLIDAARLEEGHEISVAHVSFSVEAVLHDVRSLLRPLAGHRGVELRFHLETLGPRSGDRQLLSRVLINLITNAVQAVDESGHVDVRVTEPREGWLEVEVRDDGPGGDAEELRRHIAVDAGATYPIGRTKGWTHGLGLNITSRLIRAAGGTIEVESEEGQGTSFAAGLPFPRAE